ncbi:MAG: DUF1697 domain-containing protein [Alcanivorax sp.]|uniref:DUF1697 domain-containing protein n=1 Tax=Alcanivorax sp. TaxID=1872427 RepID=UPI003DA6F340
MLRYVAFFRGLNIGRPPSPDRDSLEQAFLHAGAPFVCSFHAHGNVVFDAENDRTATRVLQQTSTTLNATGFQQPGFLRPLSRLETLLEQAPFANQQPGDYHERCVTWLPINTPVALPTFPLIFPRDDATLLGADDDAIFSVTRLVNNRPGAVNATLERKLGCPLTSRNWNIITKLVERFA